MSKTFFNNKAKETSKRISEILLSYLEADPKKSQYITSVPACQRNSFNGMANILMTYCTFYNTIEKTYVRIENNIFGDQISVKPSKIANIKNVDLLVFYDLKCNRLLIADKRLNNNNAWLDDKSRRDYKEVFGTSYFVYNIESLLNAHAFFEVFIDTNLNIIHDDFMTYFNGQVMKLSSDKKTLYSYPNLDNKIKYIQYDTKDRDTIYYCFHDEKQANKPATLLGLAHTFENYSTLTENQIYQRLYRAAKDEKYAKIPLKNNANMDTCFVKDGNIVIGLSSTFDSFINFKINKTENKKEYQKEYQKVNNWLKRHNNEFNPKWTESEINRAKEILEKNKNNL